MISVALHVMVAFVWFYAGRQRERESARKSLLASREALAALCHEQWSGWMAYQFDKCQLMKVGDCTGLWIPNPFLERWKRQVATPYADLSDSEKDSDRKEADRVLLLLTGEGSVSGPGWTRAG